LPHETHLQIEAEPTALGANATDGAPEAPAEAVAVPHADAVSDAVSPHQAPEQRPGELTIAARMDAPHAGVTTARLERFQRYWSLTAQMRWFIQLRWIAAAAVLLFSGFDWAVSGHFRHAPQMFAVGAAILTYNIVYWAIFRSSSLWAGRTPPLVFLAWTQIVLDLTCITILTIDTGGCQSPLLGFFVFHMVFASLLLPRAMAFGGAIVAVAMLGDGLALVHQLPADTHTWLILIGWATTLLLTVYIANVITLDQRRHRRRLIRKNHRIRRIKNQLQRHQLALVQQEKMAGLGQMAAGVAHEIANPLASMDSVLQLMQRKPEKVKPQCIETLREQVARIHRTVRQMTAFAHPVDDQWRTMPLNQVIAEALRLVRMDGRAKRASIREELAPDAGGLNLLPQALEQVLVNLLLNALDATAEVPEPVLIIRTGRSERWCWVDVSDNGHGIQAENLTRLFEPFFTTKPVGKGTGLGLSISYSLVRKHRGDIQVKSTVGQGTTFTVRLPVVEKGTSD